MRVFVRLGASERVMTLDLSPATLVANIKRAIVDSGQVPGAAVAELTLRCMASTLVDTASLEQCTCRSEQGRALHIALTHHKQSISALPALKLPPVQSVPSSPLNCAVELVLPCSVQAVPAPAAAIQVRGWLDQPIAGAAAYDPATRTLSLKIDGPLTPSRSYCAVVDGTALQPAHADAAWTFSSLALEPVRVLLELEGAPGHKLVTLYRRSASLLAELLAAARSRFPARHFEFRRTAAAAGPPLSDTDVGLLREGEVLCCRAVSMDARESPEVVHEEVQALDHDAYCAAHWVNAAAGYFAVVGKLTSEEEEAALLAVVSAFEGGEAGSSGSTERPATPDDDLGEPTTTRAKRARTADTVDNETVENETVDDETVDDTPVVVPALLQVRWGTPRAPRCFCLASDAAALLAAWRSCGFAIVQLTPQTHARVQCLYDSWTAFCALPLASKAGGASERYVGYHHRPHFHKELFQLRGGSRAADAWPLHDAGRALRDDATAAFDDLAGIAADLLRLVCSHLSGGRAVADALLEPALGLQADRPELSQSNLTCFRYAAGLGEPEAAAGVSTGGSGHHVSRVHCPYHSDVGLITVIPRGRGAPGLHVHDFSAGAEGWVDIEAGMPADCAVVFGGESLFRLTNHWLLPGTHEVAHIEGERLSCPFQLLARSEAQLSSAAFDEALVGVPRELPVLARHFVEATSATRVSSNFPVSQ